MSEGTLYRILQATVLSLILKFINLIIRIELRVVPLDDLDLSVGHPHLLPKGTLCKPLKRDIRV